MKISTYLVFINFYPSKNDISIELLVTQTTKIQDAVLRYRICIVTVVCKKVHKIGLYGVKWP